MVVYNPMFRSGGLANYDGAVQGEEGFRPLQRSLLCAQQPAGTQGQSILATVQPQLLPAIDLLSSPLSLSLLRHDSD